MEVVAPKTNIRGHRLWTRRLAYFRKETFEEVLKTAGIPGRYFYRRSFTTWDVLLPSEELAKKLATNNIMTKFFWLQPEYREQRSPDATSSELNGDVLITFLSSFGGVEDSKQAGRHTVTTCSPWSWTGEGSASSNSQLLTKTRKMMLEGRRPTFWSCKQLGHFARSCPQKTITTATKTNAATNTTTTTTTNTIAAAAAEVENKNTNSETGDYPNNDEGRTQITRGKKSPVKTSSAVTTTTPEKRIQLQKLPQQSAITKLLLLHQHLHQL